MKTAYLFKVLGNGSGFAEAPLSLLAHAARKRRLAAATGRPAQSLDTPTPASVMLLKA